MITTSPGLLPRLPASGQRRGLAEAQLPAAGRDPYQPLYRQVYDFVVGKIAGGEWRGGQLLPSEHALAVDLGVSTGTVRKALDQLVLEEIVERQQGRGTFVAGTTPERSLFKFFRFVDRNGERGVPTAADEVVRRRPMKEAEARRLQRGPEEEVFDICRTRLVDGRPIMVERVILPAALFPRFDEYRPIPNALYFVYQRDYGISVAQADETLRAELARPSDAKRLPVQVGAPLLRITRVAVSMQGQPVELRERRCDTSAYEYAVSLA